MKKLTSYLSLLAVVSILSAGVSPANAAPALKGFSPDPATITNPGGAVVAIGGNGTVAGGALPAWFQGQDGVAVKPCLDVARCALVGAFTPTPLGEVSYPNFFPEEAFYFLGTANFVMPAASDVLVVMAMEYTFVDALGNLVTAATLFNAADPAAGLAHGFPFQRIRLVHTFIGGGGTITPAPPAGSNFTVRTPWGTTVFPLSLAKCVNSGGDTKCSMTRDQPAGGAPSPLAALGDPVLAPGSMSTFLKDPIAPVGFLGTGAAAASFTGAPAGGLNSVTVTDPLGNTGTTTQLVTLVGQTVGLEIKAPAGTNFGVVKPAGPVLKTININNLAGVAFTPVLAANVPASNPVTASPDFTIVPSATLPCPTGIATLAAGANCNFDVQFAPVGADGPRSATIDITGAGVPPATATVTGIADGTAPALALTSSRFINSLTAQTLTGTASDANGLGGVTVTVNALAPKAATVTGGTWTFPITPALAKQDPVSGLPVHNIVVNANDTALPAPGNTATSLTPTIVVDVDPPAVTLTLQEQGTTTKNASPVLTYTATDINLAVTTVKVDGTPVTPTPASGVAMAKLADGLRTVAVEATDAAGNVSIKQATLTIDTIVSPFTLTPVTAVTRNKTQTIGGTVEAGSTVNVAVGTAAAAPATVTGTTWSFPVANLVEGVNNITVTGADTLGNTGALPAISIKVVLPDGKITGAASVGIADALKSLQFATGLVQPTAEEALHADVAPLVNNVPAPNDKVDIGDVVLILRKAVGLANW